ncbi:MAG: DMT family transporter [Paracoccaceae bacterium]
MSADARGAALMALGMVAFACGDAVLKTFAGALPGGQVLALRGLFTTAVLGALAWRAGGLRLPPGGRDRRLVLARGLAEAVASVLFIAALYRLPLGLLTAVVQALPLTTVLGAAWLFGEPLGRRRLLAIVAGFGGVLLILRPGTAAFDPDMLLGVGIVLAATVRDLITRRIGGGVGSFTVAAWTAGMVTAAGFALGAVEDWAPVAPGDWLTLMLAAGTVLVAYVAVVAAMRVGAVAAVAPFRYAGLLAAGALGWAVFGEVPDAATWVGAGIVVASGLVALRAGGAGRASVDSTAARP